MKTNILKGAVLLMTLAALTKPVDLRAQAFDEETNTASVGYGFVTLLGSINDSFDSYSDTEYSGVGPIYAKFEHAISEKVGMGLNVAYATNEWSYRYTDGSNNTQYTETTKRSTYSILVRMNFHFGSSDRFDPYAGFGLGYRNANWTVSSTDPNGTSGVELKTLVPFGMEITIGGRYYFTEHIGAYMEVGAAKSVAQAGLTLKF